MTVRERRLLRGALLGTDALALVLAVGGAGLLRVVLEAVLPVATLGWAERHVVASVLVVPILLLLFWLQGRYDLENSLVGAHEYAQIAHAVTYGLVLTLAISYFAGSEPLVSRSWLLLVWALSIACVVTARFVARRAVRHWRQHGALRRRVVIVGASNLGVSLAEQFQTAVGEGIDVVGFLDEYLPLGQSLLPGVTVLGRPGDLLSRTNTDLADEYILVPQALPYERLEQVTRLMVSRDGPVVRMAVGSIDLLTHGVLVTERSHVPLVTLRRARLTAVDVYLKRAVDIVGALLGLAVIGLPLAFVVVRGYLTGRRPMFSPQAIYAAGGGVTRLWLLHTHRCAWLPLRGSPALVAVLRGQLSLVGPRPTLWVPGSRVPLDLWVTAVKPGLTGPWRLRGPRATLEDQAVQDLAYVRNYTIWEDLRILWQSARRVLTSQPTEPLGRWQDRVDQLGAGATTVAPADPIVSASVGSPLA